MEILTGTQMREADRRAIAGGIPSLELMEQAGRGIAEALARDLPREVRAGAVILCGKGNNGGDGLVVARRLAAAGVPPRAVLLLARAEAVTPDAAANLARARGAGIEVAEVPDEAAWAARAGILAGAPLVVDALLGTGVTGGARGLPAVAVEALARCGAPVASVDVPSGLDADAGAVHGPAVRAARTYTLGRPKVCLVLEPAASHAGAWSVVPLGIPDAVVAELGSRWSWTDAAALRGALPRRAPASHKGTYGHLLAVAGSGGKSGAAVLVARGALRAGAGLVTVATTRDAQPLVAVQQAEVMTEVLGEAREVLARAAERDALAIGPGLGTDPATRALVRELVVGAGVPAVLDADGLNAFSRDGALPRAGRAPLVLTPHPGEAARLLGLSAAEVQADRAGAAAALARGTGAVVVLKGHRTLVAHPDGRLAFNGSGNPGMATGGSGDVLTGVVGALLARGLDPFEAARVGVFAHGDAGDRAARRLGGQDGLTASDVAAALPEAIAALVEGRA